MNKLKVIPHVHWDREWLRSQPASAIKLVQFFDHVLDLLESDQLPLFVFDGQVEGLMQYLAIKPEKQPLVSELVSNKRLYIGPWYVQPDMFMPSLEALIRNLLIGCSYAKQLGHCMSVGWIPDAFGQNQITPYLFHLFDFKGAYVWRGFDYEMIADAVFDWQYANTHLKTIHMPLGYGYWRGFENTVEEVDEHLQKDRDILNARFQDGNSLIMLGSDYAFPKANILPTIEQLKHKGWDISISDPEQFIEQSVVHDHFKGEARSPKLGRIHAGINSTRMDLKVAQKYYERLMSNVIEVMYSIVRPPVDKRVLEHYWKLILQNEFHDSFYASSPLSVNQSVENRMLEIRQGLNELMWLAFKQVQNTYQTSNSGIVVFNTLAFVRDDFIKINLVTDTKEFSLWDQHQPVAFVEITSEAINREIEDYNGIDNFHDEDDIEQQRRYAHTILVPANIVQGLAYKVLEVKPFVNNLKINSDLQLLNNGMENTYLKVTFTNGCCRVVDKINQQVYSDINVFYEESDDGDEYNFSYCSATNRHRINDNLVKITVLENTPYLITYRLVYRYLMNDGVVDHHPSSKQAYNELVCDVALERHSKLLKFKVNLNNQVKDHRLTVGFRDLKSSSTSVSNDQLGTITRENHIDIKDGCETMLPIYPFHNRVSLTNQKMTVLTKGIMEYEVYDDIEINLTLLRAVGWFGKQDLAVRPGRSSGYRQKVQTSEMLNKPYTLEYAVGFAVDQRQVSEFTTPLVARHLDHFRGTQLVNQQQLFELESDLELIALYPLDNQQWQLRLLNRSAFNQTVNITGYSVVKVNIFNEVLLDDTSLEVKPHEIINLRLTKIAKDD